MSGNNEHAPSPNECRECSEDKLQLRGSALENEERIGKIEQELNPEPELPYLGPYYYPKRKCAYQGQFKTGQFHGIGHMVWDDGRSYMGYFQEGQKSGFGRYHFANGGQYRGNWYQGEWLNDKKHGKGFYQWADGSYYEGEFSEGKFHGVGMYTWQNGAIYHGEWVNDIKHGEGQFQWPSGAEFVGNWVNGVKNGPGKYTSPKGKELEGIWKDGKLDFTQQEAAQQSQVEPNDSQANQQVEEPRSQEQMPQEVRPKEAQQEEPANQDSAQKEMEDEGEQEIKLHKESISDFFQFEEEPLKEANTYTLTRAIPLPEAPRTAPFNHSMVWVKTVEVGEAQELSIMELELLANAEHPNLIKPIEAFEDEQFFHVVYEALEGEDLINTVVQSERFTEDQAKMVMQQILGVLSFLHNNGFTHRNLDAESIYFVEPNSAHIKFIDFMLTKKNESEVMTTSVGTPFYVAPEVLEGQYNELCDVWSAGVILYIMLIGDPPFAGDEQDEIFKQIMTKEIDFTEPQWEKISDEAKELVNALLTKDVSERISADIALTSNWFPQDDDEGENDE